MNYSFENFLLRSLLTEAISQPEAATVIQSVRSLLPDQDVEVQLIKNALTSPQFVQLSHGGEQKSAGGTMFGQNDVLYNLKRFIGPKNLPNIQESQVLKFQWNDGGIKFVIVFLGYTKDGQKIATISIDPALANKGFVRTITQTLQSLGYKMFTHPNDLQSVSSHPEFMEKLMGMFRVTASTGYHKDQWLEVARQLDTLIKQYPDEWQNMQKRFQQIYGSRHAFYRSMTVNPNREFVEVGSENVITGSELSVGDKVYFPVRYPWIFIQMTELPQDFEHTPEDVATHYTGRKKPGDTRDPASVWAKTGGGSEPIQLILRCSVPTNRLVYSSMAVMNVSPHVRENEVMVRHEADVGPGHEFGPDHGIPCVVVSKSNSKKTTDITDPTGKYGKSVADIDKGNNV